MNVLQATLAWGVLNGAAQGRSCASGHLGSAPVTPAVSAAEPESKVLVGWKLQVFSMQKNRPPRKRPQETWPFVTSFLNPFCKLE